MGLLDGKTAIVTGAARGIGKAIALKFAAEGANIAFTDLVIDENADNTAKELEAMGVKAKGYASNAANFEDTAKVVEEIHKDFGRIDILVNNAGIRRDNILALMPQEDWNQVLDITLKGFYNVTQLLLPSMMRRKYGRIVNMASVSGLSGIQGQTNYSAAKGGLIAVTKALAKEVACKNITVNAVAPGFIKTDMVEGLDEEALRKTIPANRFGTPEEVAEVVGFLVSNVAGYITGDVISICGGLYT